MGWVVLRETVTTHTRRAFDIRRANPFGAFRALAHLPGLTRGLLSFFLYQVSFTVYPAVWAYFGQARFGWNAGMIGLSLGLFGLSMAVVQGGLIRLFLTRMGERGTVLFSLGIAALGYGAIAVVPWGSVALILTPLAAIGAAFSPALQGIMSQQIGDDRQGELQGILGSVSAVAMMVAPVLMTWVFAVFTAPDAVVHMPGAPFLLSLALVLIALALLLAPTSHRLRA